MLSIEPGVSCWTGLPAQGLLLAYLPGRTDQWLIQGFRSLHGCGAAGESPVGSLLFPDFQQQRSFNKKVSSPRHISKDPILYHIRIVIFNDQLSASDGYPVRFIKPYSCYKDVWETMQNKKIAELHCTEKINEEFTERELSYSVIPASEAPQESFFFGKIPDKPE